MKNPQSISGLTDASICEISELGPQVFQILTKTSISGK